MARRMPAPKFLGKDRIHDLSQRLANRLKRRWATRDEIYVTNCRHEPKCWLGVKNSIDRILAAGFVWTIGKAGVRATTRGLERGFTLTKLVSDSRFGNGSTVH